MRKPQPAASTAAPTTAAQPYIVLPVTPAAVAAALAAMRPVDPEFRQQMAEIRKRGLERCTQSMTPEAVAALDRDITEIDRLFP